MVFDGRRSFYRLIGVDNYVTAVGARNSSSSCRGHSFGRKNYLKLFKDFHAPIPDPFP